MMNTKLQKQTENGAPQNALEVRPAADIYEGEHDFRVVVDLPGVAQKDVNISVERDTLTLSAERNDGPEVLRYVRAFSLSNTVDTNGVNAALSAGVLTLTLPKVEAVKPRQIKVQAA